MGPATASPASASWPRGAGVNVNTARAVYRRLEEDGLIVSRHGLGTFVAEDAPASAELERLAAEAADNARASGVDPRDLARAIYAGSGPGLASLDPVETRSAPEPDVKKRERASLPAVEGDERLGRRELRRQIARLEAQLASYPAEARQSGEPTHPLLRPKGHVADMAELEQIRDELMRAVAARPRGGRASRRAPGPCSRPPRGDGRRPAPPTSGRRCRTKDLGEPGCTSWEVQPRWGPVGALMNWWRVKVSSGCPLPGEPREAADRSEGGAIVVRTVADRAFLPAKSLFEQVGNMMILTGKTITATVRPPYPYGGEFISQFIFALQLCWFPMLISTVAFGFGAPGLQAANFASLFGALDRLGGFFVLASIREFAPFVTAVVVAGVAGTAITADLGARKIREELDALQVLGVDPIKNLVVPRFLSLMLITGLLDIYALLFGIAGGVFASSPTAPRWAASSPPCSPTPR